MTHNPTDTSIMQSAAFQESAGAVCGVISALGLAVVSAAALVTIKELQSMHAGWLTQSSGHHALVHATLDAVVDASKWGGLTGALLATGLGGILLADCKSRPSHGFAWSNKGPRNMYVGMVATGLALTAACGAMLYTDRPHLAAQITPTASPTRTSADAYAGQKRLAAAAEAAGLHI